MQEPFRTFDSDISTGGYGWVFPRLDMSGVCFLASFPHKINKWTSVSRPDGQCGCSHQRSFKIRGGGGRPGGRYDAVDLVLLLGVDVLHVERRAVLGLTLGLLRVQAAVHATVAVLSKEGVDGLYPGLEGGRDAKE